MEKKLPKLKRLCAVNDISVWFGSRLSVRLCVETPERIIISKARVPEFKRWLTAVHPVD